jgi:hypothetical protein
MDTIKHMLLQYFNLLSGALKCSTHMYYSEIYWDVEFLQHISTFYTNQDAKEQLIYPCAYYIQLSLSKIIMTEQMLERLKVSRSYLFNIDEGKAMLSDSDSKALKSHEQNIPYKKNSN